MLLQKQIMTITAGTANNKDYAVTRGLVGLLIQNRLYHGTTGDFAYNHVKLEGTDQNDQVVLSVKEYSGFAAITDRHFQDKSGTAAVNFGCFVPLEMVAGSTLHLEYSDPATTAANAGSATIYAVEDTDGVDNNTRFTSTAVLAGGSGSVYTIPESGYLEYLWVDTVDLSTNIDDVFRIDINGVTIYNDHVATYKETLYAYGSTTISRCRIPIMSEIKAGSKIFFSAGSSTPVVGFKFSNSVGRTVQGAQQIEKVNKVSKRNAVLLSANRNKKLRLLMG